MNADKFLGWLTGILVLGYLGVSAYAFTQSGITWADFSGAVGPLVGTLVGYWIRGKQV